MVPLQGRDPDQFGEGVAMAYWMTEKLLCCPHLLKTRCLVLLGKLFTRRCVTEGIVPQKHVGVKGAGEGCPPAPSALKV